MSEMVERVARAIWSSSSADPGRWEDLDVFTRGSIKEDARCAIRAMREPTQAMRQAGEQYFWQSQEDVAEGYGILIDTALADTQEG